MILYTLRGALDGALADIVKELSTVPGLVHINVEDDSDTVPGRFAWSPTGEMAEALDEVKQVVTSREDFEQEATAAMARLGTRNHLDYDGQDTSGSEEVEREPLKPVEDIEASNKKARADQGGPKPTRARSKVSLNDFEKAFANLTLLMGGMDAARRWLKGATGKYGVLKSVPAADRDKVFEMIQMRANKQPAPTPAQSETEEELPPAAVSPDKEITFEDLLDQYVDTFTGRKEETKQILDFFSIDRFGALPKERYAEAAEWMTRFAT